MKTNDYGIFKTIDGNRTVSKEHVSRLAAAMEEMNLQKFFPILVNENMEIIDGQHRLMAAARLGLPVHYEKVKGLTIENVVSINTNMRKWTLSDFIDSYIELGKSDYSVLKRFIEEHHMGASLSAGLLMGFQALRGGSHIAQIIKDGKFRVGSFEQAELIADWVHQLQHYSDFSISQDREFILALFKLHHNEKFDFERLVAKLKMSSDKIQKRHSDKYYLILIEELYNWGMSKNKTELYASSQSA